MCLCQRDRNGGRGAAQPHGRWPVLSSATQRGALQSLEAPPPMRTKGSVWREGPWAGLEEEQRAWRLDSPGVCVKGGEFWQPQRPSRCSPALLPPRKESHPGHRQGTALSQPCSATPGLQRQQEMRPQVRGGAGEQPDLLVTRSRWARGYGRGRLRDEEHRAGSRLREVVYVPGNTSKALMSGRG